MARIRAWTIGLLLALGSASATSARAEAPAPARATRAIVVVEVDASAAPDIDATKLRAAIGAELGADAVAPDDARAAQAAGTIAIAIDRDANSLVVSYRGRGARVERRIDLPADRDATARAAVTLAGNLARDEGAELAEDLRKRRSAQTAPQPSVGLPPIVTSEEADAQDLARLQAALGEHTRHRTAREIAGLSLLGAGVTAAGVSLYLLSQRYGDAASYTSSGGLLAAFVGIRVFPSYKLIELDDFAAHERARGRPPGLVRDDVLERWRHDATTEHRARKTIGWILLAAAGVATGFEVALYAANGSAFGSHETTYFATSSAVNGLFLMLAFDDLISDGPVENALRDYERGAAQSGNARQFRLSPTVAFAPNGGVLAGIGASF